MAEGFIDWASLTEVANSYAESMQTSYRWATVSSIEVTCGIVHGRQLKVLPSPANRRLATRGPHDVLRAAVTEYVDSTQPPQSAVDRRAADVNVWALNNVERLRDIIDTCLTTPDSIYGQECGFDKWLSTALGANLEATGLRVGGLFDMTFARPIAQTLNTSEAELQRAWERSRSSAELKKNPDLFAIVRAAYVLSILLRGRYHDLVAREMGVQVLHHPMRSPMLPELPDTISVPVSYDVTNSERFMAQLLWGSGFVEQHHDKRIQLWAENVRLVRRAVQTEIIDLPQRASADRALETAVDAARRAGIRTHSRLIDDCMDLVLAMGVGALSSFVVNGWPDMFITLGAYAASKQQSLGERTMKMTFENRRRLKHLAETPGRITAQFR